MKVIVTYDPTLTPEEALKSAWAHLHGRDPADLSGAPASFFGTKPRRVTITQSRPRKKQEDTISVVVEVVE